VVAGPGAGNEQHRAFPLEVLFAEKGVVGCGGERGRGGNRAVFHADDSDGLEFKALHAVHRPDPDLGGAVRRGGRQGGNPQRLERVTGQLGEVAGPGGDAEGVGFDPGIQPGAHAPGQPVEVRLTGTSRAYPGRVRLLGAVIDPQTRLGLVRVSLAPDANLRPGAFARAEVTVSNADRIVLPQTAVLSDDKGSYVLIVDAQNKVQRRPVHVSGIIANGVTIADGLNGKEHVVATAGAFLQEGEVVNPVVKSADSS